MFSSSTRVKRRISQSWNSFDMTGEADVISTRRRNPLYSTNTHINDR
ncbi:MAG: hypothetical protein ACYDEE_17230 [Ignavibacteriaceae bacterium]